MLDAIKDALAKAAEEATREGPGTGPALTAFHLPPRARMFVQDVLRRTGAGRLLSADPLFDEALIPMHKWLQAVYLTDGGALQIAPHRLARVLDVPDASAEAVLQRLREARHAL